VASKVSPSKSSGKKQSQVIELDEEDEWEKIEDFAESVQEEEEADL